MSARHLAQAARPWVSTGDWGPSAAAWPRRPSSQIPPFPKRVDARPTRNLRLREPTVSSCLGPVRGVSSRTCGLAPRTFRAFRQNASRLRAAGQSSLGGVRAERRPSMTTAIKHPSQNGPYHHGSVARRFRPAARLRRRTARDFDLEDELWEPMFEPLRQDPGSSDKCTLTGSYDRLAERGRHGSRCPPWRPSAGVSGLKLRPSARDRQGKSAPSSCPYRVVRTRGVHTRLIPRAQKPAISGGVRTPYGPSEDRRAVGSRLLPARRLPRSRLTGRMGLPRSL